MKAHSDDIGDNGGNVAELELLRYLGDKDLQVQSITKYKYTKQLCLKYNTPIPSSAPVERLFSFAGLILPRRCSSNDENFERCTLLHASSCILKKEVNFVCKHCDFLRYFVLRYVNHIHNLFSD